MTSCARNAKSREIWSLLSERYPKAFVPVVKDAKPRLLAIGIREAIAAAHPEIDVRQLRNALALYCGRYRYASAFFIGAERIDLEGNTVATVSPEEFERVIALRAAAKAARRISVKERAAPQLKPEPIVVPRPKLSLPPRRQETRRPVVVEVVRRRRISGPWR